MSPSPHRASEPPSPREGSASALAVEPADFFALRTPLLPFDVLEAWGRELEAPPGLAGNLGGGTARGQAAAARAAARSTWQEPVVREALFIASPVARREPAVRLDASRTPERGQKVERTLVRYFARMAGRATPFGLFAGMLHGRGSGEHTRLAAAAARAALPAPHAAGHGLRVRAGGWLVREAPGLRAPCATCPTPASTARPDGSGTWRCASHGRERSYHLVAVEPSPYLEATLERARGGATVEELAEALVARGRRHRPWRTPARTSRSWWRPSSWCPTWAPAVTGPEPVPFLLEQSQGLPALAPVRRAAGRRARGPGRIDASAPGCPRSAYREVARMLEALPAPAELPRLFQVDMFRPAPEASLSAGGGRGTARASRLLHRISSRSDADGPLERSGGLPGALRGPRGAAAGGAGRGERRRLRAASGRPARAPGRCSQGFAFPEPEGEERLRCGAALAAPAAPAGGDVAPGAHALVLDGRRTWRPGGARDRSRCRTSFGVAGTVVAASSEAALAAGRLPPGAGGRVWPLGRHLLGRFCHGDPELRRGRRATTCAPRRPCARTPSSPRSSTCPRGAWATSSAGPRCAGMSSSSSGTSGAARGRQLPRDGPARLGRAAAASCCARGGWAGRSSPG